MALASKAKHVAPRVASITATNHHSTAYANGQNMYSIPSNPYPNTVVYQAPNPVPSAPYYTTQQPVMVPQHQQQVIYHQHQAATVVTYPPHQQQAVYPPQYNPALQNYYS